VAVPLNNGTKELRPKEYVWIAESDDYADEGLLAELVTKLDKYPAVGIAYCQSWKVDKNNIVFFGRVDSRFR